jgi:hypothetical protein
MKAALADGKISIAERNAQTKMSLRPRSAWNDLARCSELFSLGAAS